MTMRNRSRHSLLAIALWTGLTGCVSGSHSSAAASVQAYTFYARSATVRGAITDELRGVAYVEPAQVRVVVQSGRLAAPTASERPVALLAALAYGDTAGAWDYRRRGQRIALSALPLRDGVLTDSVVFVIPDTRGLDLRKTWIAFELQARIQPRGSATWADATRPIDADLDMFATAPPSR